MTDSSNLHEERINLSHRARARMGQGVRPKGDKAQKFCAAPSSEGVLYPPVSDFLQTKKTNNPISPFSVAKIFIFTT